MSFEVSTMTETKMVARFYAKGLPVSSLLIQTLGRKFPTLSFRLVLADDSYEVAQLVTSKGDDFSDEIVEVSEDFLVELDGQHQHEVDEFYTKISIIKPWPMTNIRFWSAERKVRRFLENYPVYEPPFVGLPAILTAEEAEANFQHFLDTRAKRLDQLKTFLKKFGTPLESSEGGMRELDRWVRRYGAFLAVNESGAAFRTHLPAWRGPWLGQNIIFDLATFVGEVIIKRNPGFSWEPYLDVPSGLRKADPSYRAIVVRGPDPDDRRRIWVFDDLHRVCDALRERSFMWKRPSMTMTPPEAVNESLSFTLAKASELPSAPIV